MPTKIAKASCREIDRDATRIATANENTMPMFENVRSMPDAMPNMSGGAAFMMAELLAGKKKHAPTALIVPMQTIHLLEDRSSFLRCARRSLRPGGVLAIALLGEGVEPFELELDPDAVELGPVRYESTPTALRRHDGAVVLERRRTRIANGTAQSAIDLISLADCDRATVAAEALAEGFAQRELRVIAPTREHAGSEILCLEVPA